MKRISIADLSAYWSGWHAALICLSFVAGLTGCDSEKGAKRSPENTIEKTEQEQAIADFAKANAEWVEIFNSYHIDIRFPDLALKQWGMRANKVDEEKLARMPAAYGDFLRKLHLRVNALIPVLEEQRRFENLSAWLEILSPSSLAHISETGRNPRHFSMYKDRVANSKRALRSFFEWYPQHVEQSAMDPLVKAYATSRWESGDPEGRGDPDWRMNTIVSHFALLEDGYASYQGFFDFAREHELTYSSVENPQKFGSVVLSESRIDTQEFPDQETRAAFDQLVQVFKAEALHEGESAARVANATSTAGWYPWIEQ